jgi:hypothetical protein
MNQRQAKALAATEIITPRSYADLVARIRAGGSFEPEMTGLSIKC